MKLTVQSFTSLGKWAYLRQVRLREWSQCGRSWEICSIPQCAEVHGVAKSQNNSDPGWATCLRWKGNSGNQGQAGQMGPCCCRVSHLVGVGELLLIPWSDGQEQHLHGLGEAMRGWTFAGSENRERENSERDFEDCVCRNWATHWMEYKRQQAWC